MFCVSTLPTRAVSVRPRCSSLTPAWRAARELPQAASTVQLVPPRSSRLAIRPATRLGSTPGKVFSCQGTKFSRMRSQSASISDSGIPLSRMAFHPDRSGHARRHVRHEVRRATEADEDAAVLSIEGRAAVALGVGDDAVRDDQAEDLGHVGRGQDVRRAFRRRPRRRAHGAGIHRACSRSCPSPSGRGRSSPRSASGKAEPR